MSVFFVVRPAAMPPIGRSSDGDVSSAAAYVSNKCSSRRPCSATNCRPKSDQKTSVAGKRLARALCSTFHSNGSGFAVDVSRVLRRLPCSDQFDIAANDSPAADVTLPSPNARPASPGANGPLSAS